MNKPPETITIPRSPQCPKCQSNNYQTAPELGEPFVIFHDRICSDCDQRYSVPVPKWASLTMTVLGPLIMLGSIAAAIYALFEHPSGRAAFVCTLIFIGGGGLTYLGIQTYRTPDLARVLTVCANCGKYLPAPENKRCPHCLAQWR